MDMAMCTRVEEEEVTKEEDALYIVGAPPKVFIILCDRPLRAYLSVP